MEVLVPGEVTLTQMKQWESQPTEISLSPQAYADIEASEKALKEMLASGQTIYGVNTGFGRLANQKIDPNMMGELQRKLIVSHSVGTGAYLDDSVVAKIILMKVNSLSRGYSGVRRVLVDHLLALYNHQCFPCVPSQGSVGASGDLAPLAHLSGFFLGEGMARYQGQIHPSQSLLKKLALDVMPLQPKEGLALLNGTQVSTALALDALFKTFTLFESALLAGCLSVEAALGSDVPFDAGIHHIRSQAQLELSQIYKAILDTSDIRRSHANCDKVQDPYSLRCQPQVMGAILRNMRYSASVIAEEINAVTDNPLIFAQEKKVLSGGNFHAQNIAFAADSLALAIAEIGSMSERRISLLMDEHLSSLPQFLIENPGVNSGFMIAQVTAAALVHENKQLAVPSSVDSIPTSANQEDHVSMATYAGRRLHQMCDNLAAILSIELLAASQGIDFRKPLKTSKALQVVHDRVRSLVAFYTEDKVIADDLEKVKQALKRSEFTLSPIGMKSINYL